MNPAIQADANAQRQRRSNRNRDRPLLQIIRVIGVVNAARIIQSNRIHQALRRRPMPTRRRKIALMIHHMKLRRLPKVTQRRLALNVLRRVLMALSAGIKNPINNATMPTTISISNKEKARAHGRGNRSIGI